MEDARPNKKPGQWTQKALAIALASCAGFWLFALHYNVYKWAVVGAIFEMLWLPMIVLPFLLPLLIVYFWGRGGFKFKSIFPFLQLASLGLLIFLLTREL